MANNEAPIDLTDGGSPEPRPRLDTWAERLNYALFCSGRDVADVARELGVGKATLYTWLSGDKTPRGQLDMSDRLADALGCDRGWLKTDPMVRSRCFSASTEVEAVEHPSGVYLSDDALLFADEMSAHIRESA